MRCLPLALVALCAALVGAPATEAQGFGRNKIQYDAFDWHVLRTDHFDVYYYPEMEALAEHGAHFAEEQYEELENRFDFTLTERVPLIFYSSNLHFRTTNVTPGHIPEGVGGFFEFLKGRVVIPADGNLFRFRRVVRHELAHVFTFNKLARVMRDHRKPLDQLMPLWFTEGLAEYWSGEPDHQHEMILRDAVASNSFVPLADMDRIAGTFTMYKEGEAFCRFIAEEYGEERLLDMIDEFWRGPDIRDVTRSVLGEDFRTTSDRFSVWIREQYLPDLPEADVPTLASAPVAARGFNMKPVAHRFPDGRREVVYMANVDGYASVYAVPVDSNYAPTDDPDVLVRGEQSEDFEAFHLFESRMDVSPGGLLTFVAKRGEADVMHVYDLRGRRRLDMIGFDDLVAIYSPTWSQDGQQLAFTGIGLSGFSDLFVYDRASRQLRQLTRDHYDDRDADWSPDGRQLVFSSDRTAFGLEGAYNLFTYDLTTDAVAYVTYGDQMDLSPRWSPDGSRIVFASARRGGDGRFSAQDVWAADMTGPVAAPVTFNTPSAPADVQPDGPAEPARPRGAMIEQEPGRLVWGGPDPLAPPMGGPRLHRLTRFTSAAYDPVWTDDGSVVYAAFEDYRFTVRRLDADSLLAASGAGFPSPAPPLVAATPDSSEAVTDGWAWGRVPIEADGAERSRPYRRRYQLDIAQGGVQNSSAVGASGGAVLAFSDLLGDDQFFVTAYSASTPGRSFLEGLNLGITRVHLGGRADYGYGLFREAGQRYDRADPDAPAGFPVYYEQVHGGFGVVSYPISPFRRVELTTALGYSIKDQFFEEENLTSLQLTNGLALVHDNALYGLNGPVDGWRANVGASYTTDVMNSTVSYYALSADVRHYQRLTRDVTFASWGLARANVGRRARLNLIGGSWSLRGFPFFRLRARNLWFTSHELRFPLVYAPSAWIPLLAPFGIANIRGALFADAAHLWNGAYDEIERDEGSGVDVGQTLGALGGGLRMNLFGGIVLRYDLGYRFANGLDWGEREPFRQFFFGWDF